MKCAQALTATRHVQQLGIATEIDVTSATLGEYTEEIDMTSANDMLKMVNIDQRLFEQITDALQSLETDELVQILVWTAGIGMGNGPKTVDVLRMMAGIASKRMLQVAGKENDELLVKVLDTMGKFGTVMAGLQSVRVLRKNRERWSAEIKKALIVYVAILVVKLSLSEDSVSPTEILKSMLKRIKIPQASL